MCCAPPWLLGLPTLLPLLLSLLCCCLLQVAVQLLLAWLRDNASLSQLKLSRLLRSSLFANCRQLAHKAAHPCGALHAVILLGYMAHPTRETHTSHMSRCLALAVLVAALPSITSAYKPTWRTARIGGGGRVTGELLRGLLLFCCCLFCFALLLALAGPAL